MSIQLLSYDHVVSKYPAFYNAYALRNEISGRGHEIGATSASYGDVFIDDYYGRIFDSRSSRVVSKYGLSSKMPYYVSLPQLEVVDELRVPYRRVPVFSIADVAHISLVVDQLKKENSGHTLLLRGQTKVYLIERPRKESLHFYGEERVNEPSFLPSHLRYKFDSFFLKCMWQSQSAMLLHDLVSDIGPTPELVRDVSSFRNSAVFLLFALGIAQHYGLPSVGLDLTDDLAAATWFATHTIKTSATGQAETGLVDLTSSDVAPTIFVFRCPADAVFEYKAIRPDYIPHGRPDAQSAWFGHVGWGLASNQLGSYLMCGFRLSDEIVNSLDPAVDAKLFPTEENDPILRHFLKMRAMEKYEGEARRALQGIYYMK